MTYRLVTWNVWWDAHFQEQRRAALLRQVQDLEPDIVAFQEVTPFLRERFPVDFPGYQVWPVRSQENGLALLGRGPWLERGLLKLTSHQGRQMAWCRNRDFLVGTVHLESMASETALREAQLEEIFGFLESFPNCVLMGDFNFAPDWPEQNLIPSDFCDAWSGLHPRTPGYTEDTHINRMRLEWTGKEKQVRFDRVLYKGALQATAIELLGTDPLPEAPDLWPSDHFGLCCDIEPVSRLREVPARLMLLGCEHQDYGSWTQRRLGSAVACISVGADRESPSMAAKGDPDKANEDALLVLREGDRYLLAAADGHFGTETSHTLLQRLARLSIARDQDELLLGLRQIVIPEHVKLTRAGSTLTVAVYDAKTRSGFGRNIGDTTLAAVGGASFRVLTPHSSEYFYVLNPTPPQDWEGFSFQLADDEALLLYTDGVNECCYRQPERSIRGSHLQRLRRHFGEDTEEFAGQLVRLALTGVDGHPGGQDNIALIVLA